jgi:hypothetical protein
MAPKKEVPVVETKVEDTCPWGAFINVHVPSAVLALVRIGDDCGAAEHWHAILRLF